MSQLPTGTVTLLFTDIEGSTHLLQQLGEHYANVLAECRQLLRTVFHRWNGYEVDTQGDSFFVVFARASDAIWAAVDMQRALAEGIQPDGVMISVRMGLHTGEPLRTAEGYVGLDVHRAVRIMSVGHGGQVLLSQTTCELVKQNLLDGVSFRDLGEHRLKDLQRPTHLYQLVMQGLPADFPPLNTLDCHPNNLPVQLTPLIGREEEVAAVQNLLQREDVRLVTLTGTGGTGKTRLGLQVAAELCDQFVDGMYFVNLAPISDPALVIPTIAQTLDIKEIAEQPLLDLLKGSLHWKHVLLLLDNFEQVVDASVYVAELLIACPLLKVIVTSREVLHVRGEQEFPVPPLAMPDPTHLPDLVTLSQYDALALFLQHAQAVKPDFQMTKANAPVVAEICIRLEGLPLAIELAAARIKLLSPQALLARLDRRLQVLTQGSRDLPERQQTLHNTIQWSYNLLNRAEQRLFRQLSAFVGGCTLEAVEAICDTDEGKRVNVLEGVGSLLNKSLIYLQEQRDGEQRLMVLEMMREFGLECLAASEGLETTRRAYAAYYLQLAEEAQPQLQGVEEIRWFARLEQEHENFRAALTWLLEDAQIKREASKQQFLHLCAALCWFWILRGHLREGQGFLEQAVLISEGVGVPLQVKVLIAAAELAHLLSDFDRVEALCEKCLLLSRELGDAASMASALFLLGRLSLTRNQYARARTQLEEAQVLFQEVGPTWWRGRCLIQLSFLAARQGDYNLACLLLEEYIAFFRQLRLKSFMGRGLGLLAQVLFLAGEDLERARVLAEQGLATLREEGDRFSIAEVCNILGEIHQAQGEQNAAYDLFAESVALFKELGDKSDTVYSLVCMAGVTASRGDKALARVQLEESLALLRELGDIDNTVPCLEGLAAVLATQGELRWAVQLWGSAETLREAIGNPLPPIYHTEYKQAVDSARVDLGVEAFATAWTEGRTMTPEQAIAAQGKAMISSPMPASTALATPVKSSTTPAGLTTREVEVLRLLATGLTDAQIAEQLVLSLHTIHAHLRTIHSKLGVTSRSAATRYAFEHLLE